MTEYIRNKYPELKQGCDRRDMYAYLSTLMQMTKEKDIKKYSKLQNEIMTYIKSNRSKILKDKKTPTRLISVGVIYYNINALYAL